MDTTKLVENSKKVVIESGGVSKFFVDFSTRP